MVVTLLMFIILFACAAMLYNDGMWSNSIRLINTITAGLLAMTVSPPQMGVWALNPLVGLTYLFGHGLAGFLLLGAVFLCATATIGNPRAHAARLIGIDESQVALIDESGAPRGDRRFFFYNPPVVNR